MPAIEKLAHAYYRYSDLDDRVNELNKQYVPKSIREAARVGAVIGIIVEKKLSWKWSFK